MGVGEIKKGKNFGKNGGFTKRLSFDRQNHGLNAAAVALGASSSSTMILLEQASLMSDIEASESTSYHSKNAGKKGYMGIYGLYVKGYSWNIDGIVIICYYIHIILVSVLRIIVILTLLSGNLRICYRK